MDEALDDLQNKLSRVLGKQEYDYMKCYSLYVKKKEREIKELIMALSQRSMEAGNGREQRITVLEHLIKQARDNEAKMDRQVKDLKSQIQLWKERAEDFKSDNEFLKKHTMKTKRKNKLLKAAIERMQTVGFGGICPKCAS
jgi:chromosome segregation ATPase